MNQLYYSFNKIKINLQHIEMFPVLGMYHVIKVTVFKAS